MSLQVSTVKGVLALSSAALLWIFFVHDPLERISEDPLKVTDPEGVAVAEISSNSPVTSGFFSYNVAPPDSKARSSFEMSLWSDGPDARSLSGRTVKVALMGRPFATVQSCDDPNIQLQRDVAFEGLTPRQKEGVTAYLRTRESEKAEASGGSVTSNDLELTDLAGEESYVLISWPLGADGYDSFKCSLSTDALWSSRESDVRLDIPRTSFTWSSTSDDFREFEPEASVAINGTTDLTTIQSGGMARSSDESGVDEMSWSSNSSVTSEHQESQTMRRDHEGLSVTFSSLSRERDEQDDLFIGGVALGLLGSLAIGGASLLLDSAFQRRTRARQQMQRWSGGQSGAGLAMARADEEDGRQESSTKDETQ